jgi:hypothetical protein
LYVTQAPSVSLPSEPNAQNFEHVQSALVSQGWLTSSEQGVGPGLAILSSLRVGCFGNGGRASSGLGTLAATAVAASAGPDADNAVATVEKRANARIFKDIGLGMGNGATSYNNNTQKKGRTVGSVHCKF